MWTNVVVIGQKYNEIFMHCFGYPQPKDVQYYQRIYLSVYIIITLHYSGPIERSGIQGVLKLKVSHQLLVNADGTHLNKRIIKNIVNF